MSAYRNAGAGRIRFARAHTIEAREGGPWLQSEGPRPGTMAHGSFSDVRAFDRVAGELGGACRMPAHALRFQSASSGTNGASSMLRSRIGVATETTAIEATMRNVDLTRSIQ